MPFFKTNEEPAVQKKFCNEVLNKFYTEKFKLLKSVTQILYGTERLFSR
jgi:hypothetical protein